MWIVTLLTTWFGGSVADLFKAWVITQVKKVVALMVIPWVLLKSSPGYIQVSVQSVYLDMLNAATYYVPVPEFLFRLRIENLIQVSIALLFFYGFLLIMYRLVSRVLRFINRVDKILKPRK